MKKKAYKVGIKPLRSRAFHEKIEKNKIKDSKKLFLIQALCLTICCLINMSACFNQEASEENHDSQLKYLVMAEVFLFITLTIFEIILVFNYEEIKKDETFLHFYRNYSCFFVALILVIYSETEFSFQESENDKLNYGSLNLFFSFVLFTFLSCVTTDFKKKVMTACMLVLYLQARKLKLYQKKDIREILIENFVFLLSFVFCCHQELTEKKRIEAMMHNNNNLSLCSEILDTLDIGVSIITNENEYIYSNRFFQIHFTRRNLSNLKSLTAFEINKHFPICRNLRSEVVRKTLKDDSASANNFTPTVKNQLKQKQRQKSDDENNYESSSDRASFYQKSCHRRDFDQMVGKLLHTIPNISNYTFTKSTQARSLKNDFTLKTKEYKAKTFTTKKNVITKNINSSRSIGNFITVNQSLQTENLYYMNEKNDKKYETKFNQIYFLEEPAVLVTSTLFNPENDNKNGKATELINSELLSDICNNIKTPINCFIFLLEYLKDDLINKECKITNELINPILGLLKIFEFNLKNIFDFHKISIGDFKLVFSQVLIFELIKETAKLFEDSTKSDLEFQITTQKDIPLIITSDPFRLKQVLLNILNMIDIRKGIVKIQLSSNNLMSEEKILMIKVVFLSNADQNAEYAQNTVKSDKNFNFQISNLLVKQLNSRNFGIEQHSHAFSFYISDFSEKAKKDFKLECMFYPQNDRKKLIKEEFEDIDSFEDDLRIKNQDLSILHQKKLSCKFLSSMDFEEQYYSNSFQTEEKSEEQKRINFGEITSEKETDDFSNLKYFNTNPKQCGCSDILIAEESTLHKFTMKLILKKCGLIIDTASNSFEAIEKISNKLENCCCTEYKIIFADFMFISKIKSYFDDKLKSKLVSWNENNQSIKRKEEVDATLDRSIDFNMIKGILKKYL